MNYIKEAENYLRHYNSLKESTKHALYMINQIKNRAAPSSKVNADYEITGIHAGSVANTLNDLYELQIWHGVYEDNMSAIEHIDEMLLSLDDRECMVLRLWYIQNVHIVDIARELNYTERRSVYNLKNRALKNFAVKMFGLKALKAI